MFHDFKRRIEVANPRLAEAARIKLTIEEFWRYLEVTYQAGRDDARLEFRGSLPEGFDQLFGGFGR